jgi:LysM repeat protein
LFILRYFKHLFVLLLVFSFVYPAIIHAGILSFIEKILNLEKEDIISSSNAATMSLLRAPMTADLSASRGTGAMNIVDQNSLLANAGPLGTIADIESAPSTQISIYTVRKDDTLSEIAKMFKVSVNTIRWANDLSRGDVIKPGDHLVILPISGVQYTVKNGDTLFSIAKKFGSDAEEIARFNDLNPESSLAMGQFIVVPNGEINEPSRVETPVRRSYSSAPSYVGYYTRPIKGGYKSQGNHGYNGVDLATDCGASIFAAASGDVLISKSYGWNGGYGNYIVISHPNGTQTLYSHNSKNTVVSGEHVAQGQVIGYIGSTGLSTGCHVHFEVRGAKNPF